MDLVIEVYNVAEQMPKSEEYNLKSQIKRAIVSVPLNIAEGKARGSSKDFAHFLNIVSASLTEVEVVIIIAQKLKYLKVCENVMINIKELEKMINSLRSKLLET